MIPDEADEGDTERDGFLSYAWEWHAFSHGVYMGLATKPWRAPPMPKREDVRVESHYYRGGYVIGTLLQVGLLVTLGGTAGEMNGIIDFIPWL